MNINQIYDRLFDEDKDARVCKDISDDACKATPKSFFLILISQLFSKLGDAFSDTKIVLPWVMNSIGVPAFFIGLLVPIRESGSLIPQLLLGGFIRQFPVRKWFYVTGCFLQATSVFLIGISSFYLTGQQAGITIIGLLIIFSLSRSLCSIASKDVVGKTVPRSRRGRLGGYSASIAGAITVMVAGLIYFEWLNQDSSIGRLLLLASAFFACAGLLYVLIEEYRGATASGANGLKEGLKNMSLLKDDATFRQFIIVRALLMCSSLSAPYFVLLTNQNTEDNNWHSLAIFMVISGVASLISGPFWGKLADLSSRKLMQLTGIITAGLCLCASATAGFAQLNSLWLSVGLFFLLCVTHQGVRLGRKTYVLDIAEGNRRTDYVAVSNTLIGLLLLITGLLSALIAQLSHSLVLMLFAGMGLLAFMLSRRLPEP